MMRLIGLVSLVTACLLMGGMLHAQSTSAERKAEQSGPTAPPRDPPAEKKQRQRSKPADSFKPSERIGADSAVSFPVDI